MNGLFPRLCALFLLGLLAACQTYTPHASRSTVPPPKPKPAPIPQSFASPSESLPPTIETGFPSELPSPAPADAGVESNVVLVSTKFGDIVIELDPSAAPKTVANFKKLVAEGYYNGTTFHRVIPNFMIQGGDPNSKAGSRGTHGTGGPGYTIPAEIKLKHARGSVAMARLGDAENPKRESSGSQFFICVAKADFLDGQYTVFGKVLSGMDVVDKIVALPRDANDNPVDSVPMKLSFKAE